MMRRDPLQNKRVLVVGFARQGRALARWLPSVGARVRVNDGKTADQLGIRTLDYPDAEFILGEHPESVLERVDLICVSGGVPLDLPILDAARAAGMTITNDAQLFLERCPAPSIGITGSAGKTTTTTLVGQMMTAAGFTTHVGGNIGDVLLDVLPHIQATDVVVMELSSFQLELMTVSPIVGAILNITPNHLDRHRTMEAYIAAKAHIMLHQNPGNYAVLGYDNDITRELEGLAPAELAFFSQDSLIADGAFLVGNRIVLAGSASYDGNPHTVCAREDIPLRGEHNVANVLAACAIAGSFGMAADRPPVEAETMAAVIRAFQPVAHRLELVRVLNGVSYINDSIATAPERLVAALRSYDEPLVLLLGGADKDLPWEKAVSLGLQKARHIVVFGKPGEKQVRPKVEKLLKLRGADERVYTLCETLEEAVLRAQQVAQAGDVVLLSPGGTSYDAYPDFAARGEHFRRLVAAL